MRKPKKCDVFLLLGTTLLLLCGSVSLCFPTPRFSETENRYLAAFPTFDASALANGSYTAALDSFACERVPFRALGRAIWSETELALLRREAHGVILCRDGSLCRRLEVNEQIYKRNLLALPRLEKALGDLPFTVALAPRRIDVRNEVLPALYDTAREQNVWNALPAGVVTFLDVAADAHWYRTDHHWTSEGAYSAYVRLSRVLGFSPYSPEDFKRQTLSESFLGSSAAAAGFCQINPDTVSAFRFQGDEEYHVFRDGVRANFKGLYDLEKLEGKDTYAVFLGGNCGELKIEYGEGDTRPTLLVIKDSFANSLLPFLARHYRILAIDPRYQKKSALPLAKEADAVLVLCGMQTLTQENFFASLFK